MAYNKENKVGYFFSDPKSRCKIETKAFKEFRKYDEENPHIWREFVIKTKEAQGRGYNKISAHFIFQILRWETGVRAEGSNWKVDHNHFPYYSRKFMEEYPESEGIFEIRKLTRK